MIIYQNNKLGFLSDIRNDFIVDKIIESMKSLANKSVGQSEVRSWQNSLQNMFFIIEDEKINNDIGIAIEYNLPRSNKRIDFIITGYDKNSIKKMLIIELKQWESCSKVDDKEMIVKTYLGGRQRETVHPSYQAFSYAQFLNDFSEIIYSNDNISLKTCAYLHNYDHEKNSDILDDIYKEYLEKAPLFFKKTKNELKDFISTFIPFGDNCNLIKEVEKSPIKPAKSLQTLIKDVIDGNEVFTLLDEQKEIYEEILYQSKLAQKDGKKRVLIIPGGPGTGKTVIAFRALSKMLQNVLMVCYASKNKSLREVYSEQIISAADNSKDSLNSTKARVKNLMYHSGSFRKLDKNSYDAIIVDESHRLIYRDQYGKKGDGYDNQIQEIIHNAKLSIFFIDEKQIVTASDIGTIEEIIECAKREKISEKNIIITERLKSQFRVSGADEYISFVDHILYNEKNFIDLEFLKNYDLQIFDDPEEMFEKLKTKNVNNNARCVAGYCWEWKSKNGSQDFDIQIGNFKKKWNLDQQYNWLINKDSFNEIGCIHTCQGLEIDHNAVIIGEDLIFRNGKVLTDWKKRAITDKSLNGLKKFLKEDDSIALEKADSIIRNTYNVLLTRGIKSTYIYCQDNELNEYLKSKLKL